MENEELSKVVKTHFRLKDEMQVLQEQLEMCDKSIASHLFSHPERYKDFFSINWTRLYKAFIAKT